MASRLEPVSYRDFRLPDVLDRFKLVTREAGGLFADRPPIQPSPHLQETLRLDVRLASMHPDRRQSPHGAAR